MQPLPEADPPAEERRATVETPCKDCCFAVYAGTEQTGCQFGRIEKFRERGVGVKECYDDDKEFFVVETLCNLHRHRDGPWYVRNPSWDRKRVAREEVRQEVDVVMVMTGHTVEQVKTTVDSLLRQTLLPLRVTVSVNQDGIPLRDVRAVLPGDWIAQVVRERRKDGGRVSRERCIDNAVYDSKAAFYAVFTPGFVVPPDFVASIDRAVNDDLMRFSLLEPDEDGQGMVVQTYLHGYVRGNADATIDGEDAGEDAGKSADSLVEKARHMAKVNDMPHMIKRVGEVVPSMARREGTR